MLRAVEAIAAAIAPAAAGAGDVAAPAGAAVAAAAVGAALGDPPAGALSALVDLVRAGGRDRVELLQGARLALSESERNETKRNAAPDASPRNPAGRVSRCRIS